MPNDDSLQGTKEKVVACWQCGALQMFLLLAVSLFLLCGAAGLHVAIEDSYDVEFFVTKSSVLSLGVAVLIVVCFSVADVVTSPQYTSLFLTADTLTDMSPLGCRVTLPLRYGVVLAPQLIIMVATFCVLYRLKTNILGEKYETVKVEKATKHLSFVHALLMVVIMFSINAAITATSATSQDETLIYIYAAFNILQAVAIFYCIGFHCTPLIEYMTDSAKRRREAMLQDMADPILSSDDSNYSEYSETTESRYSYTSTGTSTTGNDYPNFVENYLKSYNQVDAQQEGERDRDMDSKRLSKRVSFHDQY